MNSTERSRKSREKIKNDPQRHTEAKERDKERKRKERERLKEAAKTNLP